MKVTQRCAFVILFCLSSFGTNGQTNLGTPGSPPAIARKLGGASLWGDLSPGPYRVGFRLIYDFDRSRTWRETRAYGKKFEPDTAGRPIRVSVWYPAAGRAGAASMQFDEYVTPAAPRSFAEISTIIERHDRGIAALDVPPDQLSALLGTLVAAVKDAPPVANRRFPLVLHFGGLDDATTMNVSVMAEFLASYGYVVATVPLLGQTIEQTSQSRTAGDIETAVRDMEFAWSILRKQPDVDNTKLGVTGHSLGGVEAVLFAMRNADVSAVIGLDGTYGFAGNTGVLTGFYDYAPERMGAAFLDLRKPEGEQDTVLDMSAVNQLVYSDRAFITVPKMHHSDFTSFAMIAQQFHLGNTPGYVDPTGWTRETGYKGYQAVCEIVRDFFDQSLKADAGGSRRLNADVSRADGTLKFQDGKPKPPSPTEFAALISQKGFSAATAIVDSYRNAIEPGKIVNESVFNSFGYSLIAQKEFAKAIGILRLVTYVYPGSANAADSLGDAYVAAGQQADALTAFEKAIELVANDARFNVEAKRSFVNDERTKIANLK